MHGYKRSARVGDLIRREVADILQYRLKDPRVGFLAVTDVSISDDLKNATVFLSIMDRDSAQKTLSILNASAGFVKSELGKRLRLRYMPKITFMIDEAVEKGERIDSLLRKLKEEEHGGS